MIARRKRPRRRRRTAQAALGRQADWLWSRIVRSRGRCEIGAGCNGSLQAAHGFSRRYRGTRWNLLNGFCLCAGHHMAFTHDPLLWDDHLVSAWGLPVYEELRRLARRTTKDLDLEEIVAKLKQEAER